MDKEKKLYKSGNDKVLAGVLGGIAEYLGITRDTALAWIKIGMPGVKVGRIWKFKISEVDEWMRSYKKK